MLVVIGVVVFVYFRTWFCSKSLTRTFEKLPDGFVDCGFWTPLMIQEKTPMLDVSSVKVTYIDWPLTAQLTDLTLMPAGKHSGF